MRQFSLSASVPTGSWQAYAKDPKGWWLPIGSPQPRAAVDELVATLKSEGRMREPHAVPL